MSNQEKVFAKGFIFKRNENAPTFVIGNLSINEKDAAEFISANSKNGWVNLKINQAQNGNYYVELDTWKAKETLTEQTPAPKPEPSAWVNEDANNDLPF
jgi:hypothetical protein